MTERVSFELVIEGRPLDSQQRIIGALVRRLGGTVELEPEELMAVQGAAQLVTGGKVRIDAGNFYGGLADLPGGTPGDAPTQSG